ncbi:flavin reductase family protein [Streptomyces sp. NPDC058614]|uniref:flavin reductase family protein n=1 Tax=Streptomyces sp. NPDC058614 TaxID=3346557 RepID=UPI00365ECCDC
MAIDQIAFRHAMTQFGSGVTIPVTVDGAGQPRGFTANSFCSVAMDPPLVLVCLAHGAESYPAFRDAQRYAIHVLSADQGPVALRFAEKRADKFEDEQWSTGEDGLPELRGALARVSCEAHAVYDGGDHAILVGRVVEAKVDETDGQPLLYFRRKFLDAAA